MPVVVNGETRLYPIVGDPIRAVRSPEWLSASLAARGVNALCLPMQVPQDALAPVLQALEQVPNVDGLLVTMPHKAAALAHCTSLSPRAGRLGAVSVMRRGADGGWHGDILDGEAFVAAQRRAGARPEGARVLLAGAGGAGSAIALALLEAGVSDLILHDRNADRAGQVIARLADPRARPGPPDPAGCDMVCNATPLGMAAGDPLPFAAAALRPAMVVGDVVAGHGVTPLIRAARAAGCRTAGGDAMVAAVQAMMLEFLLSPPFPRDQ